MDQLAAEAKLSRSEFLRNLIQEALEDAEDLAVSRKRLADEADGWVSLDELRAEAGR
jgi:metal-responsive CopG/Arc/MetJ family transcriptional regulator